MMALIVGGAYQGKYEFAKKNFKLSDQDFVCGKTCTAQELQLARGLNGLHHYVRRLLESGSSQTDLPTVLFQKVIICDEIGCGVIPMDAHEEHWREATGRLCCDLASKADLVIRVHAGIGQAIKGRMPCSNNL